MTVGALRLFLLPVFLAAATAAFAGPLVKKNTGGVVMKPISGLNQEGVGPKLSGGRPARSRDWPASFYSDADGSRCTATLVGPRALILAAHCVGDQQMVTIEVRGTPISGLCTHAEEYATDASADYALCYMHGEITGIVFETINRDPQRIKKGATLLLSGFGCTQPPPQGDPAQCGMEPPSGGNDGVYRIGNVPVRALPTERPGEPNTILTWGNEDQAMICPGDSGGGAYLMLTAQKRFYISVNSRVCYWKSCDCEQNRMSYLSSLATPVAGGFLDKWIAREEAAPDGGVPKAVKKEICGVNLQGPACR